MRRPIVFTNVPNPRLHPLKESSGDAIQKINIEENEMIITNIPTKIPNPEVHPFAFVYGIVFNSQYVQQIADSDAIGFVDKLAETPLWDVILAKVEGRERIDGKDI